MLPNGYKLVSTLWSNYVSSSSTNAYFDTGVYPSNTLKIDSVFKFSGSVGSIYFFGARNSNSDTSAGQIGFGANSSGYPQIAYHNKTNTLVSTSSLGGYYGKDGEELTYFTPQRTYSVDGGESVFTGTRTMYILARDNGGSVQYGSAIGKKGVDNVKISDNGTMIKNYVPVFDGSAYGLYDLVNGEFITKSGGTNNYVDYVSFKVTSGGNGKAVILDERVGEADEILVPSAPTPKSKVRIAAMPDDGYAFDYWENNGTVVSRKNDLVIEGDEAEYVAHFVKVSSLEQSNGFRAMFLEYGGSAEGDTDQRSNTFVSVRSASIKEDIMSKSTSTIVLDSIPSTIKTDIPVVITDAMNKQIFIGFVKSIQDKTITVREPLAVVDGDFVLSTAVDLSHSTISNYAHRVAQYFVRGIMSISNSYPNPAVKKLASDFQVGFDETVHSDADLNYNVVAPAIKDNSVVNAEDHLLSLANEFMFYFEPSYVMDRENYDGAQIGETGQAIYLYLTNPYLKQPITFGNNSEEIVNVTIDEEEAENTVLEIFDASGTQKGIYGMKDDGTIAKMTYTNQFPADVHGFVANQNCKLKVVMSDDPVSTLKKQYLSNSFFNHKITFDVDLTKGTFKFDDFELCRPVNFYYENRLYRSIVTAREYSFDSNGSKVKKMTVTLGKVRNKLTAKLNLGKLK